ncbi:NADH-quinone oxidoreductase subunit L [Candidatus Acetothermia bacterium]|nr:NADH-quinone oxidoreductase subunit L [Candidatus Acetothermia bacterium]
MMYLWLVPALPLLGFLINALLGSRLDRKWVGIIGSGSVGLAFIIAVGGLVRWFQHNPTGPIIKPLFDWVSVGDFTVRMSIHIDQLSLLMMLIITGVGGLIHIYSIGYMSHDRDYARYFAYLNLFTGSMLILVMADNYLLLFMGWEGVGLCSYLLIGHWFEKKTAADAARKAFIVNRIGDFGFLLGLFLIFQNAHSLNYLDVFKVLSPTSSDATLIGLLLFAGAVGKSAQIPLYVWLPDAMEGPTPVSALIHAATMVTAGVYVIVRSHSVISPAAMEVVAVIGAVTALFTATMALVNNDIKRVLAYSTVSQLGYMFLAAGVGAYSASMFHLTSHAFMKACLFLGAGSVMHALGGEQTDMQKMGGLYRKIKGTAIAFIVAAAAMAGIPPLVGFFSKDLILEKTFGGGHYFLWVIGILTALLTSFYMFRAVYLTFFGKPRYSRKDEEHIHESPNVMLWPVWALAVLSVIGGFWLGPGILGWPNTLHDFLKPVVEAKASEAQPEDITTGLLLLIVSILIAATGWGIAYYIYLRKRPDQKMPSFLKPVYNVLYHKYWVDEAYYYMFIVPGRGIAHFLATAFDLSLLDGIVNGIGKLFDRLSGFVRRAQSGFIRNYATWMMLGVVGVLLYWMMLGGRK